MQQELADAIANGYERWAATGDRGVLGLFSPEFADHVSGQRGLAIFDVVARWQDVSFADRRIEHHATMHDGDRVLVWYTQHGRHIGNGFPRLVGRAINGRTVAWPQLHAFRVAARQVIEHWAIRDDFALLEQLGD